MGSCIVVYYYSAQLKYKRTSCAPTTGYYDTMSRTKLHKMRVNNNNDDDDDDDDDYNITYI